jgi:hypothetical protein
MTNNRGEGWGEAVRIPLALHLLNPMKQVWQIARKLPANAGDTFVVLIVGFDAICDFASLT